MANNKRINKRVVEYRDMTFDVSDWLISMGFLIIQHWFIVFFPLIICGIYLLLENIFDWDRYYSTRSLESGNEIQVSRLIMLFLYSCLFDVFLGVLYFTYINGVWRW